MPVYETKIGLERARGRLLEEYQFSQKPRPYDDEVEAVPGLSHGHEYLAMPTGYRLKGIVVPQSDRKLFRGVWLGVLLETQTPTITRVTAAYCQAAGMAMEDQLGWHKAVQRSLRSTLPSDQ